MNLMLSLGSSAWFMDFAPLKTRSLLISWKRDTIDHPPLFLNNCPITGMSSLKILGFVLDSSFTWGPHVNMIVSRAQNNGLSQVIFRPTLVYDRASPIWEDIFYYTFPMGKPMIVCNNVPTLNE